MTHSGAWSGEEDGKENEEQEDVRSSSGSKRQRLSAPEAGGGRRGGTGSGSGGGAASSLLDTPTTGALQQQQQQQRQQQQSDVMLPQQSSQQKPLEGGGVQVQEAAVQGVTAAPRDGASRAAKQHIRKQRLSEVEVQDARATKETLGSWLLDLEGGGTAGRLGQQQQAVEVHVAVAQQAAAEGTALGAGAGAGQLSVLQAFRERSWVSFWMCRKDAFGSVAWSMHPAAVLTVIFDLPVDHQ